MLKVFMGCSGIVWLTFDDGNEFIMTAYENLSLENLIIILLVIYKYIKIYYCGPHRKMFY